MLLVFGCLIYVYKYIYKLLNVFTRWAGYFKGKKIKFTYERNESFTFLFMMILCDTRNEIPVNDF